MRKFLTALIVVLLGLTFVAFAIANRQSVTVSFNPFHPSDPALAFPLPLFVLLIMAAILGVVVGGSATWLGQRHWRRAARRQAAEARAVKAELADLRAARAAATRTDPQRLPAPSQIGPYGSPGYGSLGQDKQRATM